MKALRTGCLSHKTYKNQNWQSFSIGANQYVQFIQPDSSSVVLNRVIGSSPTSILGSLTANGQVFLVNPNGVLFGKGASLDVQSLVASTLDISDSDFMAGHYVFSKGSGASDAGVVNQGQITAHNHGYVVLAGDYAENDGIISARMGHVVLAAGSASTLTLDGNQYLSYEVNSATLSNYAGVTNTGELLANGGGVLMTADVANALKATVVNNSGLIEAQRISNQSGQITLTATGGDIVNSGTLNAQGKLGYRGGDIVLKGDQKTLLTSTSNIDTTAFAGGGTLEVSGHDIAVRGQMKLGQGGHLLLDPATMTIISGSGNGTDSIGTAVIDGQLNSGANVSISATTLINNSSAATKIKSTGTGNLTFTIGNAGTIALSGMKINIGGNLTASNTGGEGAHLAFGQITAHDVTLNAAGSGASGTVTLHGASGAGTTIKRSIAATGSVTINANNIDTSGGSRGLNISAASNVSLHAMIGTGPSTSSAYTDDVNITAGGKAEIGSMNVNGAIKIKAARIGYTGSSSLHLEAVGDIKLKGQLGSGSAGSYLSHGLDISAGGTATLDHAVLTEGSAAISINAAALVYNGTGNTFKLSAAEGGGVSLNAAIGSAAAPVNYNVDLGGPSISVASDIYTKGSISIEARNIATIGGSHAITLSADDGKSSTHSDSLHIAAQHVSIGGMAAVATTESSASVDHSVTLHAGQDVSIAGSTVALNRGIGSSSSRGVAVAVADGSMSKAVANNTLTISAWHNIGINGDQIYVGGGIAHAVVGSSNSAPSAAASANARTVLTAGHDVHLNGNSLEIAGGSAYVSAFDTGSDKKTTVKANTSVTVSAGHDITASGSTVNIHGGDDAGFAMPGSSGSGPMRVVAVGDGAQTKATVHTDVTLSAGDAVFGSASGMTVRGGDNAAGMYSSNAASVVAVGNGAKANAKVTSNVSITAGAGGIQMGARYFDVRGGDSLGVNMRVVEPSGSHDTAVANVQASVALATSGDVALGASHLSIRGGNNVAGLPGSSSPGPSAGVKAFASASGDRISITALAGVSVTAGGNLVISAAHTEIAGGSRAGLGFSGGAGSDAPGGGFTASIDAGVNLSAGNKFKLIAFDSSGTADIHAGASAANGAFVGAGGTSASAIFTDNVGISIVGTNGIKIAVNGTGSGSVPGLNIHGGNSNGQSAHLIASGPNATATMTVAAGVNLNATNGAVTLSNTGGDILLQAGSSNAGSASAQANDSGSANMTVDGSLNITATSVMLSASSDAKVGGGDYNGEDAKAQAQTGGIAALTANAGVSIKTGGDFTAQAGGLSIYGASESNGHSASAAASSSASAKVVADGRVNITAGGDFTASATNGPLEIFGGKKTNASHAKVKANFGGSAKLNADASVNIKAGGAVTLATLGTGSNAHLSIYGGSSDNGQGAVASASSVGTARLTANTSVNITAGGAFVATAGGNLYVYGQNKYNGSSGSAHAHNRGQASYTADGSVNITAASIRFNTGTNGDIGISGGYSYNGAYGSAFATNLGTALYTADAAVNLTATTGDVTLTAGHNLTIDGGHSSDGYSDTLTAKLNGKASLTADASVNIAGDNVSFRAGGSGMTLSVGYNYPGQSLDATASSGGMATQTVRAGINIDARSGFTAAVAGGSNKGKLNLQGAYSAGQSDSLNVHNGGVVNALVDANLNINVSAGNLMLKVGGSHPSGSLNVYGEGSVGANAHLNASNSASATLTALGEINLTASGVVTLKNPNGYMSVAAGDNVGKNADIQAQGLSAKATLAASGAINIKGASVQLSAGTDMSIAGGDKVAAGAHGSASSSGNATLTADGRVNITATGGGVTAVAGGRLNVFGGSNVAGTTGSSSGSGGASVRAQSSGRAIIHGNAGVNITAATTAILSGGSGMSVYGDNENAYGADVIASSDAFAKIKVDASVHITAGGALTLSGGSGGLSIYGGSGNAGSAALRADTSGQAKLVADSGVYLKGSSVALTASDHMEIKGGEDNAYAHPSSSRGFYASSGGLAKLKAKAGVSITATAGAVTATATSGGMSIYASSSNARYLQAKAQDSGAQVLLTADNSVNIAAATNISLKADDSLKIHAGNQLASQETLIANNGGVTTLTAKSNVNLTAGGAFSARAGSDLSIYGGSEAGNNDTVKATGVGATVSLVTEGNVTINAKGNATLKAGGGSSGTLTISGKSDAGYGQSASISAASGGAASETAQARVSISAGGNLTVIARGPGGARISGGPNPGYGDHINGNGGSAKLTADSSVALTANGDIAFRLNGGDLLFRGGGSAGRSATVTANGAGGAANLALNSSVNVLAGGSITLSGVNNLTRSAGSFPGTLPALTSSSGGVATVTANLSVNMSGSAVSLTRSGSNTKFSDSPAVYSSGGLVMYGSVNKVIHAAGTSVNPLSFSSESLSVRSMQSQNSFGATRSLRSLKTVKLQTPAATQSVRGTTSGNTVTVTGSQSAGNLPATSLTHLVTVVSSLPSNHTSTPMHQLDGYPMLTLQATDFTPSASSASSCLTSLISPCAALLVSNQHTVLR